jgi:hypothetical protein
MELTTSAYESCVSNTYTRQRETIGNSSNSFQFNEDSFRRWQGKVCRKAGSEQVHVQIKASRATASFQQSGATRSYSTVLQLQAAVHLVR